MKTVCKRVISILLLITMLLSSVVTVYADDYNGGGTGSSGGRSGSEYDWGESCQGFRITIVDAAGNKVSNSVDFLFSTPYGCKELIWNSKVEKLRVNGPNNIVVYVSDMLKSKEFKGAPDMPAAMYWDNGLNGPVAQGEEVKKWMLGDNPTIRKSVSSSVTSGGKSTSGNKNTGSTNKPSTETKKTIDINKIANTYYNNVLTEGANYKLCDYTYVEARGGLLNYITDRTAEINQDSRFSESERAEIRKKMLSAYNAFTLSYWETLPNPTYYSPRLQKASIDNGFIQIGFADKSVAEEKKEWIREILGYSEDGVEYVFNVKNFEKSVVQTMQANNYKVIIEPILWYTPGGWNCKIYGTITGIAQYLVSKGYGYNSVNKYENITNKVGSTCLVLERDEIFTDKTIKAPPARGNSEVIKNKTLQDQSLGYALHCYSTSPEEGATQTWDAENYPTGEPGNAPEYTNDDTVKKVSRIVKVYEEEQVDKTISHVGTFERIETVSKIVINDEPQYKLIEWEYGTPNNPVNVNTTWDEAVRNVVIAGSGTYSSTVDIADTTDNNKTTTLYVRLRLLYETEEEEKTPVVKDDDTVISESQISKAINTGNELNSKGSKLANWGNYFFTMNIEAAVKEHSYQVHGRTHSHSRKNSNGTYSSYSCSGCCNDYTAYCSSMSRANSHGDNELSADFKGLHSLTGSIELSALSNAHKNFQAIVKNGNNTGSTVTIKETGVPDTAKEYKLNNDANQNKGVAYLTTIWRGTVDKLTFANYKKSAMSSDTISKIQTMFGFGNTPVANRNATSLITKNLEIVLGFTDKDDTVISACSGGAKHHSITTDSKTATYSTSGTKACELDFTADILIKTYSGKAKNTASKTVQNMVGYYTNLNNSNPENSAHFAKKCSNNISFYPYIRMSFAETLDAVNGSGYQQTDITALKGTSSSSLSNYLKNRTAYVLSDKKSTILPTNAVEVSWLSYNEQCGLPGLQITSQQWSTHDRATDGSEKWKQKNSVLPGGAIYFLSTQGTESYVEAVTYSTLVEADSLSWITTNKDEYSVATIIKNNDNFIKEFSDIIDNLSIVQWVNKDYSLENAWDDTSTGLIVNKGTSLSKLGLSNKTSQDSKYYLVNKAVDGSNPAQESDLDILGSNYSTVVYKVFTDTEGNVYVAYYNIQSGMKPLTSEQLNEAVNNLKNTSGTNVTSNTIKIGNKNQGLDAILNGLKANNNKLYALDMKTGIISNVVNSVLRNSGSDANAAWVSDGAWYNEAFDGIYVVAQQITMKVGIGVPSSRTSVLDPNLCPVKSGKGNIFTNAHISQFRLASKSESEYAKSEDNGYVGSFNGIKTYIPNLENMYISRPFYIPNANVQDLN